MSDHTVEAMNSRDVAQGIRWQSDHCMRNGSPATGRVLAAMLPLMSCDTQTGMRMVNWPGKPIEDAMPLRLAGGLHNLHLTGADDRLGPIYAGEVTDQAAVDATVLAVVQAHDERLVEWFSGPPQTNEAGRSAGIMAQLLWLSVRPELSNAPKFELNEIGASAGINTMIDRFAFDLGGVRAGPASSPMLIKPEWRGPPPPQGAVEITAIEGCDLAPMDLTDPALALRLKSYVWPDMPARLARIDAAIALARDKPPRVAQMDAADWVEQRLATPQAPGVARVLFHSIVWQYLPPEGRARIEVAMAKAGAAATRERPLAWVAVETNRATFRHELRVRFWPGGEEEVLLGQAHAHGVWVEWY